MNKFFSGFLVLAVFLGAVGLAIADEELGQGNLPPRKIIVFKKGVSDIDQAKILRRAGGMEVKKLRHRDIKAATLSKDMETELALDQNVERIEDDIIIEAFDLNGSGKQAKSSGKKGGSTQPSQVLPWGINRIDAEQVWPLINGTGAGVNIGIIDTGISLSHQDLVGNIKGGISEVGYTSNWNDDNGHGSHVAGIVGAVNNTIGVVGVGPAVNLYAIKVLDRNGSGYLSDVINGIDWAIANNIKVINLSLGTSADAQSMHDAVARAYNAGILVVAAAGNSGGSVSYPAAYPETVAVAAVDSLNNAPYWSSRGPEVDLAAPGVNIYSTYKGTAYSSLSGTSMAAPHVAGTAALMLGEPVDSAYDANHNGVWEPDEVLNKLQSTAIDLGVGGTDFIYGYGLVNAFSAFK